MENKTNKGAKLGNKNITNPKRWGRCNIHDTDDRYFFIG